MELINPNFLGLILAVAVFIHIFNLVTLKSKSSGLAKEIEEKRYDQRIAELELDVKIAIDIGTIEYNKNDYEWCKRFLAESYTSAYRHTASGWEKVDIEVFLDRFNEILEFVNRIAHYDTIKQKIVALATSGFSMETLYRRYKLDELKEMAQYAGIADWEKDSKWALITRLKRWYEQEQVKPIDNVKKLPPLVIPDERFLKLEREWADRRQRLIVRMDSYRAKLDACYQGDTSVLAHSHLYKDIQVESTIAKLETLLINLETELHELDTGYKEWFEEYRQKNPTPVVYYGAYGVEGPVLEKVIDLR